MKGIRVNTFPFQGLKPIGVLLHAEYPSTIVYADSELNPFIVEWVDIAEDGFTDRYYCYPISKAILKAFMLGDISHQKMIRLSDNKSVVFFDNDLNNACNVYIVGVDLIENQHIPNRDSIFTKDKFEDWDKVFNAFELEKVETYNDVVSIQEVCKKYNSELLHIHLNTSNKVKHGEAPTELLAAYLHGVEQVYHELALDNLLGKNRKGKAQDEVVKNLSRTRTLTFQAASFSVYLQPYGSSQIKINTNLLPNSPNQSLEITAAEGIFQELFTLISHSADSSLFEEIREKYSIGVFQKFVHLTEELSKAESSINLEYYSPVSFVHLRTEKLDKGYANSARDVVKNTETSQVENLNLRGKFTAINCKTRHYTFVNEEGNEFSGYFDSKIAESVASLNFVSSYNILLEQTSKISILEDEPKLTNLIVATYPSEI